ncbi:cytochrome c oxidase polypeptide vi [Phlyctema vagabunda]|uniref:Cytochrome c oxidase subunit 6, mitochondrial n=1 Tax=Phlyctema vagabunda TaxID=108571 RepID=A0ABR4PHY7_9HELO
MSSASFLRIAVRAPRVSYRAGVNANGLRSINASKTAAAPFSMSSRIRSAVAADKDGQEAAPGHHEESFEEFTARYEKEFETVQDVFELQRNLNNAFAYDLVPSPSVLIAALKAARRVNDYPTAVRIFEGIKAKVENKGQYEQYLEELKPLREELGVSLKEDLYPEESK